MRITLFKYNICITHEVWKNSTHVFLVGIFFSTYLKWTNTSAIWIEDFNLLLHYHKYNHTKN